MPRWSTSDLPLNLLMATIAGILLVTLLFCEKKSWFWGRLLTKTSLSCMFVVVAMLQPASDGRTFLLVVCGLSLCMAGDVALVFRSKRAFVLGLVAFLLGHIFYILAFGFLARPSCGTLWRLGLVLLPSTGAYLWLRPHLGRLHGAVVAYMIVITAMVTAAWSVFSASRYPISVRLTLLSGAVLFYLSDLFVARDRFLKKTFGNRLIGLPLYYCGQFLLAASVGFMG